MKGVATYYRIKRRQQQDAAFRRECDSIIGSLGTSGIPQRCDRKIARHLLLHSPWQWMGRLLQIRAKSLGLGVYLVSIADDEK